MSNDADSHQLLSVVAAVHHQGVGKTLNDRALGLAEALGGISTSGVREVNGLSDLNVITAELKIQKSAKCALYHIASSTPKCPSHLNSPQHAAIETKQRITSSSTAHVRQRNIPNLNILVAPLVEELDAADFRGNIFGQHREPGRAIDLDFPAVGHV